MKITSKMSFSFYIKKWKFQFLDQKFFRYLNFRAKNFFIWFLLENNIKNVIWIFKGKILIFESTIYSDIWIFAPKTDTIFSFEFCLKITQKITFEVFVSKMENSNFRTTSFSDIWIFAPKTYTRFLMRNLDHFDFWGKL